MSDDATGYGFIRISNLWNMLKVPTDKEGFNLVVWNNVFVEP